MRVEFGPDVEGDLSGIADFIALDSPRRALSFVGELEQFCFDLCDHATAYPVRADLGDGVRVASFRRYLIVYQIETEDVLYILRIISAYRDLESLLS